LIKSLLFKSLVTYTAIYSIIYCKPPSGSQVLLNSSNTNLIQGFELLSEMNQDICFPYMDIALEDKETSTENSNTVSSMTDFEILSILNQVEQFRTPCVGEVDISNTIQSGINFEAMDPNPQMALTNVVRTGQVIWNGLKQLGRVTTKRSGSEAPKAVFKHHSGLRIQSVNVRALPKGQAFLAQQKSIFKDSGEVAKDRLWRYMKGQKIYNKPRSYFGEVLNPLRNEKPDPRSIKFGQASVSDSFGDGVRGGGLSKSDPFREMYDDWEVQGRKLTDVINDLKNGKLTAKDFPIEVFKYKDKTGAIHWITLNNRSLTVLRGANIQPSNIKVVTVEELSSKRGADNILSVLNRLVAMPKELPSTSSYIRVKGMNNMGELRESWNWDAPFRFRIGY
jgi:hypothetical protein